MPRQRLGGLVVPGSLFPLKPKLNGSSTGLQTGLPYTSQLGTEWNPCHVDRQAEECRAMRLFRALVAFSPWNTRSDAGTAQCACSSTKILANAAEFNKSASILADTKKQKPPAWFSQLSRAELFMDGRKLTARHYALVAVIIFHSARGHRKIEPIGGPLVIVDHRAQGSWTWIGGFKATSERLGPRCKAGHSVLLFASAFPGRSRWPGANHSKGICKGPEKPLFP